MDILLSAEEARILGALMEKEITTPEYYPMSLNALVNACNQKSCREPVMSLDESTVGFHIDVLRDEKRLAGIVSAAGSRAVKYKQRLTENYFFSPAERAILCELLLRGPQTPGELRNRAERMHAFANIDEVNAALKELETRPDGPWVVLLPKMPGHKEARYMHLMCGAPEIKAQDVVVDAPVSGTSPVARIAKLEDEVASLRAMVEQLSARVEGLKGESLG